VTTPHGSHDPAAAAVLLLFFLYFFFEPSFLFFSFHFYVSFVHGQSFFLPDFFFASSLNLEQL